MAHSARDDTRHLDEKQADLVVKSRHPGVQSLDTADLEGLEADLRGHREQARREASSPGGGDPAASRSTRRRSQILTQAVKRVSRERGRRDRHLARSDLREFAADVTGHEMNAKAGHRGSAKGFADAAERTEEGEATAETRTSPIGSG